jgi:hypothetical protein
MAARRLAILFDTSAKAPLLAISTAKKYRTRANLGLKIGLFYRTKQIPTASKAESIEQENNYRTRGVALTDLDSKSLFDN